MLILISVLLFVLVCEVGLLLWSHQRSTPTIPFPPAGTEMQQALQQTAGPVPMLELLRRSAFSNEWCHHSWRPSGHPDILEAIETPGLAVRGPDGVIEGRQ